MKIYKSTRLTDSFKCPLYAESKLTLPYKACLDRQIKKSEYGTIMYPECRDCKDGKEIARFFKTYQYTRKVVKIRDTQNKTGKRLRKGEGIFSPHYIGKSKIQSQGIQVARNRPHKPDIGGSIPPPATKSKQTLDELIKRVKYD